MYALVEQSSGTACSRASSGAVVVVLIQELTTNDFEIEQNRLRLP
jgi:hypothetical protein